MHAYYQTDITMSKKININIDRSDVLAIMALLVSLGAIFISIKQTKILKDQQKIMASQQEGSVWPYVKIGFSMKPKDEGSHINLSLTNKGVGPAKVKSFSMKVNDKAIKDNASFFAALNDLGLKYNGLSFNLPNSTVISSGEKHEILNISFDSKIDELAMLKIFSGFQVCYCSIYDECYGDCDDE